MTKRKTVWLTLFSVLAIPGLAAAQIKNNGVPFAFKLFGEVAKQDGNVLVSPHSVRTAVAMTYIGSDGATATQIANTCGFSPERAEAANEAEALSIRYRGRMNKDVELVSANALWVEQNYKLLENFTKLTQRKFSAIIQPIDFSKPGTVSNQINAWVNAQTRGKIRDIITPEAINPDMRTILVNTVFLKAGWAAPFAEGATQEGKFFSSPSDSKQVKLMHAISDYFFSKNKGSVMIEIPYAGRELVMYAVLPNEGTSIAEIEKQFTAERFWEWRGAMKEAHVDLKLPRFAFGTGYRLMDDLKKLGIKDAFSSKVANFSRITDEKGFSISQVIHKARIEVDEHGTVAVAATAIGADGAGPPRPQKTEEFHADHPFLFMIFDKSTDTVLFIGRYSDPSMW